MRGSVPLPIFSIAIRAPTTVSAIFCVIGGVGLLRFPELYSRTHAATITDTLGAGLLLVGLMLQAGPGLTAVELVMVLIFLFATVTVVAVVQSVFGWLLSSEGVRGYRRTILIRLVSGGVTIAAGLWMIPRWGLLGAGGAYGLSYVTALLLTLPSKNLLKATDGKV